MSVIAIESTSTNTVDATTIAIDTPSGTVDGDLLVAVVGHLETDTNFSTIPSGWTSITTADPSFGYLQAWYRIASSEGSSYTWGWSGSATKAGGIIFRLSGYEPSPTITSASDTNTDSSSSSQVFTAGITPPSGNTFYVLAYLLNVQSSTANITVNNYAIATSNPTWTERYERGADASGEGNIGVATATRFEETATGNVTITLSNSVGASADHACILIGIRPIADVSISPAVITSTLSVQSPSITGEANISPTVVTMTASVQAPTVTITDPEWSNKEKNSSSWVNKAKS